MNASSATIYRRFPTHADLLVAAFQERVRTYADLVDNALNVADPWQAFSELLDTLCERQSTDAGSSDDPNMWKRHINYVIDGLRARS